MKNKNSFPVPTKLGHALFAISIALFVLAVIATSLVIILHLN